MVPSRLQFHERRSGDSTSRSLLERLNDKDPGAWRELVHLYAPLIVYWCRANGVPIHDCDDILQDVFRTVVTNIDRFRKERLSDTFRGWLRTITRSRIADRYRSNRSEPVAAGGTDAQTRLNQLAEPEADQNSGSSSDHTHRGGEADLIRELYSRAVQLIRDSFEEQTWRAFWRVVVDGCSAQEVAQELGMRPGTVRVAKSRVLKRLREQLGDSMD
jgi:RNA polymerase sigma-70 factor (ECF subfamily)